MSKLRELTGRELDVVGGGFLNNKNFGTINFNNNGTGGAGGNVATVAGSVSGANGGAGVVVGSQIGQQVNGIFSLNGIIG
jgi:hypothetical protein